MVDTGATRDIADIQTWLHDALTIPTPPRAVIPPSPLSRVPTPWYSAEVAPSQSSYASLLPVSLFDQHITEFPRIRKRSSADRASWKFPLTSWGQPRTIARTPPPAAQSPLEEYLVRPLSEIVEYSGSDPGLSKLIQERKGNKRGGHGTFIPGPQEPVEEILQPPPRPDSGPTEFMAPEDPVTQTWYSKRPKSFKPDIPPANPTGEPSEPSSPLTPPTPQMNVLREQ
ncbi:hypothetical protein CPB86DRAFT_817329 [Serendipita vermifera]|nr:hypothetical protein CPB86DRAFT_817329 [Serendipita vermifera]